MSHQGDSCNSIITLGGNGDGITDNTSVFATAISKGGTWLIPTGNYCVNSNQVLLQIQNFIGCGIIIFQGQSFPVEKLHTPLVLNVPGQFSNIQDAIDYGSKLQISSQGSITVQISDGTYSCQQVNGTIVGGSNAKLFIRGNETDASRVVLNFDATANKNGFFAEGDAGFAWINGITINGIGSRNAATSTWNDQCYGAGIRATNGASIVLGGNVVINDYYYGVSSRYNATIKCNPGVIVNYAGDCGFHAFAATIDCVGCFAYYCADGHLGFGFCSESGGFVDCSESTAAYNKIGGIYANGAHLWAHSSTSHDNQLFGYYALNGGFIECTNPSNRQCHAFNNTSHGYYASNNSYINAIDSLSITNGQCGYCAEINSTIDVTNANGNDNTTHGFCAMRGSTLIAYKSNAYNNSQNGYFATANGYIQATDGVSNKNGQVGIYAENGSTLELTNFTTFFNSQSGLTVNGNCVVSGDNIKSTNNGGDGFHIEANSSLRGNGHIAENNQGSGFVARIVSVINCYGLTSSNNSDQMFLPSVNNNNPDNIGSYIMDPTK